MGDLLVVKAFSLLRAFHFVSSATEGAFGLSTFTMGVT